MKLDNDIHNYYEHLVIEHLTELGIDKTKSADYVSDLSCIVLNQLPPRYIRFQVDMAFYMPQHDRIEMEMKVKEAIERAINYLDSKDLRKQHETT
ncbi:late competence development ComFB family protein [Flocculibacter collagenilyticus]|uniref:late competence development ComFB family protein n=1 Tax=Flocculibacter collagenilyticus TaxID=2744479 RepID=UPI0018F35513|nr:late competence development ComFB family protein [Flocculibacter collagenilyticus]